MSAPSPDADPTLAQVLSDLCDRGWSTSTIAEALDVTWWTVHRWRKGQTTPHPGLARRLLALWEKRLAPRQIGGLTNA